MPYATAETKRLTVWVPCVRRDDTLEDHVTAHSRGAMRPGFAFGSAPQKSEGAGKTGCALHPRSRVQNGAKKRTRAYRFSGDTPAFPAQWFDGLCRALPGDEFVLSPSSAD